MLKVTDVASMLNVRPATVHNWITKGLLTPEGTRFLVAIKAGKSWRVRRDDLDAFLDMNEPPSPSPQERKKSASKKTIKAEVESLKRFLGMI